MSFVTFDGSYPTNPLTANDSHLILSNTNVTDSLVLAEFQDPAAAYQPYREGWLQVAGRSVQGAIKLKGANYTPRPRRWGLNLLANSAQVALFEQLLANQPAHSTTMIDSWEAFSTTPINVVIAIPERYRSRLAKDWHLLQFEVFEDI
jgi:hypothetical protein